MGLLSGKNYHPFASGMEYSPLPTWFLCVYDGAVQVGSGRVTKIRKATLVLGLPSGWSSLLPSSPRPLGLPLLMTFAVDYLSYQPYGLQ